MTTGSLSLDGVGVPRVRRGAAAVGIATIVLSLLVALVPTRVLGQDVTTPQSVFVPRTGHTADGLFLEVWRTQRALLGDPITEELSAKTGLGADPETEQLVQYFENAALVYLPEEAAGNQVRTLPLGRQALAAALAARPAPALTQAARRSACGTGNGADCAGVQETGNTVNPVFRTLWNSRDQWLGVPVSEAYRTADGSWIQYFEATALRAKGDEVGPLPIGTMSARRLDLETGRVVRPSAMPLYAATLFASQPVPPTVSLAPSVGAESVAESAAARDLAVSSAPEIEPLADAEALPVVAPEAVLEPALDPVVEAETVVEPEAAVDAAVEPLLEPEVVEVAVEAEPVVGPGPQQGASQEIVVSLSAQTLWAYEGSELVQSTAVSTGTAEVLETTTPIGSHSILSKVDIQDMAGTISGEDYFVADVPYVMYFDNLGNALHGTYWHSNFGTPMSHGCINLPMEVASWMYGWASVGTAVTVIP